MSTAVKVTLGDERIALRPGEAADVEVTIQNGSQVVEHFATSVVGLPSAELFSCEPDVVKLRPKEVGNVRLKISLPDRGGLVAGPYVLGVLVRSPYQREVSRCEELALDVQPTPALTMGVQPEVANGGKTGQYTVSLTNEGNTPLAVTLAGADPENRVGFDFQPRELRLDPGMAAGTQVTAHATPPLTGQEVRRAMTLRAHAGDVVIERPVTLVQRPRIRSGLMKVGGAAAALTLLAGAAIGGALLIRDAKQSSNAQPTNAATQTPPPANNAPNQTSSTQPSTVPSTSAPAPATSTTTGPGPQQPIETKTFINFATDAEESGEKILARDRYVPQGLQLTTKTDKAPPGCEGASAQVLRMSRDTGFGGLLSSADPLNGRACNNLPLEFVFINPARNLRLGFAGAGAEYKLTIRFADGRTEERLAKSTTPGAIVEFLYEAPKGLTVKSATFGKSNPDPRAKDPTVVKHLGFTPA